MVAAQGPSSDQNTEKPAFYVHDGLDRRDLKVTEEDGQQQVREYSYIGTSEALSRELRRDGKLATYDYSSSGERMGQRMRDDSGDDYHPYAKDANGSVEALEDEDGSITEDSEYHYDPYGELDDPDPEDSTEPEELLSGEAKQNPFRFEGFYYDSAIKTYDMQAREYRPDVGRFLSADRFEAAGMDLALQSDPLTQNRYAFAGGNPVSNIEWDGHWACSGWECAYHDHGGKGGGRNRGGRGGGGAGPSNSGSPSYSDGGTSSGTSVSARAGRSGTSRAASSADPPTKATVKGSAPPELELLRPARPLPVWEEDGKEDPREDEGFIDYLGNDLGGDLSGLLGFDFGFGDPDSQTYQAGEDFYGSPGVQIATSFIPGLGPLSKLSKGVRAAKSATAAPKLGASLDDLARFRVNREQRLQRLATAGTPVGKVRNFDVPDPAAAASRVTRSLTQGPGIATTRPRPGVTVHTLPEGGQVILRSPAGSRSGLWAVDAHSVPGLPSVNTHFRSHP